MNITHYTDKQLFQTTADGYTAYLEYTVENGRLLVLHTVVPPAIGGRGIAAELVKTAFDYARRQGWQPAATCSYALIWLQRHPAYTS
mgnify:FL=1